ncbi:hypothetical protein [Flavobacterium sp.]|uniref:hypothetical protein n=1 Tax=Flavobacterium sp. TaxID=239 RepID=UPI0037507830
MKNYNKFTSVLLMFIIATTFLSCEKDLYEQSIQNNSREVTLKEVSLKNLDKSISSRINSEISKIKKMKYETTSDGNRIEYDSNLNIYIDTENGNLISVDGKNFYTFPMFKDAENKIENILFADKGNGEIDTYLIKYNVSPEVYKTLTREQIQNLEVQYQKIFWSGGEQVCFSWTVTTTTYPGCPYPKGTHPNGVQCEAVYNYNYTTLCTTVEDNSGGGDGVSGGDGVGGDTSGGHTGGGSNSGGIYTGISTLSPDDTAIKNFIHNLTPQRKLAYINQVGINQIAINEYLIGNNFSIESINVITDGLDVINEDPDDAVVSIMPFLIEEKIDDSELDPCTRAILNKLKHNHKLAKILSRFEDPNALFNIKFSQVINLVDEDGQTLYGMFSGTNENFNYTIQLNSNFYNNSGSTHLGKASTIIHELIHALIR